MLVAVYNTQCSGTASLLCCAPPPPPFESWFHHCHERWLEQIPRCKMRSISQRNCSLVRSLRDLRPPLWSEHACRPDVPPHKRCPTQTLVRWWRSEREITPTYRTKIRIAQEIRAPLAFPASLLAAGLRTHKAAHSVVVLVLLPASGSLVAARLTSGVTTAAVWHVQYEGHSSPALSLLRGSGSGSLLCP